MIFALAVPVLLDDLVDTKPGLDAKVPEPLGEITRATVSTEASAHHGRAVCKRKHFIDAGHIHPDSRAACRLGVKGLQVQILSTRPAF